MSTSKINLISVFLLTWFFVASAHAADTQVSEVKKTAVAQTSDSIVNKTVNKAASKTVNKTSEKGSEKPAAKTTDKPSSPIHWSAKKTLWNRKDNIVELFGHAVVHQLKDTVLADYIKLDQGHHFLYAKGNVVYFDAKGAMIFGDEMNLNTEDRTGVITNGRITTDSFTLTGEKIQRHGPTLFSADKSTYTTCRDCSASWTLTAGHVDLEFDGYAFMSNVKGEIKDAPFFWSPYLIVPIKTRRQTGLLFPRWGYSNYGFRFVQPFFWAINRSSDMTVGYGAYGGQGRRLEWEGRYVLGSRSSATANYYQLNDKTFSAREKRWALNVSQTQEFPFGIEQKLRLLEASDNLYPQTIGDIPGAGDAVLPSSLIFSHTSNQVSSYVAVKRFRNLLYEDPVKFDQKTVQLAPTAEVTTNDRFWFGTPVATGLSVGVSNFTRAIGAFDQDRTTTPLGTPIRPGIDPIRKATRVDVTPSMYTTFRPAGVVSVVPSVEYRSFYYSFQNDLPSLNRGYMIFQSNISTQLERIFDTEDPGTPRVKHLIRPELNYSLIPRETVYEPKHPFLDQIQYARNNSFSGFNFDNRDIVPIDNSRGYTNYFYPQGNALAYGVTSQLIRRKSMNELDANYQRSLEFQAGQSFNFRELRYAENSQQPFSRLYSTVGVDFDQVQSSTSYYYYPYSGTADGDSRNVVTTDWTYIFEKAIKQRILSYERSFTLGFSYNRLENASRTENFRTGFTLSLNDYIMPSANASYDVFSKRFLSIQSGLVFQSPSQCWRFALNGKRAVCELSPTNNGYCMSVNFDFALNLSGSGYGNVADASTFGVQKN